jgi:peptidoglycan/xylan/chitin deacetylase (PgdA/CDA1 family)
MFKKTTKSLLGFVGSPFINLKNNTSEWSKNTGDVFSLIFHVVPRHGMDPCKELLLQLEKKHGFIDPEEFTSFINGDIQLNRNHLLLTFDDGFISNHKIAQDILKPLQIKAIFFVPTGFINAKTPDAQKLYIKENLFLEGVLPNLHIDEMKPMTWENISELVDSGHTIGAHTKNHFRLSEIDNEVLLEEEIISSGDRIEELLGIKVEHFAYPFGDIGSINKKAFEIASSRYKYIYSGIRGPNKFGMNLGAIRREAVNISDGIKYNTFIANGGLSFYYWRARRRLDAIAL